MKRTYDYCAYLRFISSFKSEIKRNIDGSEISGSSLGIINIDSFWSVTTYHKSKVEGTINHYEALFYQLSKPDQKRLLTLKSFRRFVQNEIFFTSMYWLILLKVLSTSESSYSNDNQAMNNPGFSFWHL